MRDSAGRAPAATRPLGSLTQRVTERIRQAILDGEVELGDALSEDKLATTLGVSRSPVRQALAILEQQGLIDVRPQRGSFVFTPNLQDIRDLCEFRRMIETDALRLAMERGRAETIGAMRAAADRMRIALETGDSPRVAQADEDYHRGLLANSGNPYLLKAYELFAGKVAALRSHRSIRQTHVVANQEHYAIVEMLEAGELPGALEALGAHVLRMDERFRFETPARTRPSGRAARASNLDRVGPLTD